MDKHLKFVCSIWWRELVQMYCCVSIIRVLVRTEGCHVHQLMQQKVFEVMCA